MKKTKNFRRNKKTITKLLYMQFRWKSDYVGVDKMTTIYLLRHSQPFRKLLGEYNVNEVE